jgi:hypothetical protein
MHLRRLRQVEGECSSEEYRRGVNVLIMRSEIPSLSKSLFMSGLQCQKRLYLECYAPELGASVDPATEALRESGRAIGSLARQGFPDGMLIGGGSFDCRVAEEQTRAGLADPRVPAIYEAAFSNERCAHPRGRTCSRA